MLQQLMSALEIEETPESWERNIQEAIDSYPGERIGFLQENHLIHVRKCMRLSEERAQSILETMAVIRRDDNLRKLAWLWHCILYRTIDHTGENIVSWPLPAQPLESRELLANWFPAVILLSGYERLEAMYKERDIPDDIIADTLAAVDDCIDITVERTGRQGLHMHYLNWLQHHFHCRLYRIGRLEYEFRRFAYPIRAFRHVRDGRIMVLSDDGISYRGDGLVEGTNSIFDEKDGWVAAFKETAEQVQGNPISPDGLAQRNLVTLSKSEWSHVLSSGEPVINLHIPRKGAFTAQDCSESFARAIAFLDTYYADQPYAAVTCVSWLMDPQLRLLLDDSSNLVRFQLRFQSYPVKSGDESLYKFVFNCEPCEVDQLPEKSSLQQKIKRFMQAGERLHLAGGLILADDFQDRYR